MTVLTGYAIVSALLIAVGRAVVGPLHGSGIVHWDEDAVRWLASHRTPGLTSASAFWSRLGDAPSIIGLGALAAIVLLARHHARLAACLALALAVELGTFLTISYTVGRDRPTVPHLGSVPSTGSFPSGHIAATFVLYGAIAVILTRLGARRLSVVAAWGWTVFASAWVAWARMYRGMHHPIDIGAGLAMGIGLVMTFAVALRRVEKQFHRQT